jgi:hypothetical protein
VRVLRETESVAVEAQRDRSPSLATFAELDRAAADASQPVRLG